MYNLFKMKPTRWTLLLTIFISTSLYVSGNYVPIIRKTYCIVIIIIFIYCNWVVTRWQWLFYMYTEYEIGY